MGFVKYDPQTKFSAVSLYLRGFSKEEISNMLAYQPSQDSLDRWAHLYATTRRVIANPDFYAPRGAPTILSANEQTFIEEMIQADPTLYLDEVQQSLAQQRGYLVSISTLAVEIRDRMALTVKRVRTVSPLQNEMERARYMYELGGIDPNCLMFMDETSIQARRLHRPNGRAPRGCRTKRLPRATSSRGFVILPAISLDGCMAQMVQDGPVHRVDVEVFLMEYLLPVTNPWPGKNSVLIMDNATIHHGGIVQELCDQFGVRLIYLPAYSPDYNPIEKVFNPIKARFRRTHVLDHMMTAEQEAEAIYLTAEDVITPELVRGVFHGSIYLSHI